MAKRIVTALILVLVVVGGYYAVARYRAENRATNGEVLSADGSEISDSNDTSAPTANSPTPAPTKPVTNANSVSSSLTELQSQSKPTSATNTVPASDSQAANAPNGMTFAGTGKFQVYRQGNLTWRVDTESGSTCILFATNEEWRKPVVYNHGCGNS